MMLRKIFFRSTGWLPILSLLLFAGCETADDRSDCFDEVFIRFEYTLNKQRTDLFTEQAEGVDVYVYDTNGSFVSTARALRQNGTLGDDNRIRLVLPQGDYRIVAWANLHLGDYSSVYDCPISEKRVSLISTNGQVTTPPNRLMHGMTDITVSNQNNGRETTVSMTKNTNNVSIILNVNGKTQPVEGGDFSVNISGCNGAYRFDNSLAGGDLLQYIGTGSRTGAFSYRNDFRVLRLLEDGDMRLDIDLRDNTRAGESITLPFSVSLTEEIMKHPDYNTTNDLDREDEYTLEYTIDDSGETSAIVLIKINDWNVIEQGGPIGN